jgi:capsid protein
MIHAYRTMRVGQKRGIPWFAAVIESFKQIDRYHEAEVTAAVLSAMVAIVTKTEDRDGMNPLASAVAGTTPTSGASDAAEGSSWDGTITPGLAVDLGINEEIGAFKSEGRPNPQFDPFVQAFLRQVGVALELPFEVLIKHFTASYSAARSALLEAWKFYRTRRSWLAESFCQPVVFCRAPKLMAVKACLSNLGCRSLGTGLSSSKVKYCTVPMKPALSSKKLIVALKTLRNSSP